MDVTVLYKICKRNNRDEAVSIVTAAIYNNQSASKPDTRGNTKLKRIGKL